MDKNKLATAVVKKMYDNDAFSQWMGIQIEKISPGYCLLSMKVRAEMLNGFGILHGGVGFSLADSALAFAANSHGRVSVLLDASYSCPAAAKLDDLLTAEAEEVHIGYKIAIYRIIVSNQKGEKVGIFNATVYRKKEWENI